MGAPRFVLNRFWPSNLFLGGIPGAWYDPTDLSTMFQDSTGTTPVTAVEQPVGLILDKSQGLALGAELVTNGDFSGGTTGWTGTNVTLSIENGMLKAVSNAAGSAVVAQNATLPLTGRVLSRYYVQPPAGRSVAVFVRNNAAQSAITTTGVYQSVVQPAGTTEAIAFLWTAAAAGEIAYFDDITVRTIAGNHASQSTAASRPTYRARYNLLTFSEQFDNAAWTKYVDTTISANVAVAPDGTTTADLMYPATSGTRGLYMAWSGTLTLTTSLYAKASGKSWLQIIGSGGATASGVWFNLTAGTVGTQKPGYTGTIQSVGNGWYRCVVSHPVQTNGFFEYRIVDADNVSVVTASGGADGLLIWGAQVLTAADVTATGNAYQRIAAATVYDTAPIFRPYLAFDGVDDSLSTAAINFTSTDKMTVVIGVNKQSDAVALIAEISPTVNTNAGSFGIGINTGPNYFSALNGNALAFYTETTYTAPATNVVTTSFDIAGAAIANEIFPRVNAAIPTLAATGANAGTGNFGNWPLYIASRAGSGTRLTGRLYSLIVRGAASSTTEIIDTETWVNQRTGAF